MRPRRPFAPHPRTPRPAPAAGGPGCSSELAVFFENGPYQLTPNLTVEETEYGWDTVANMVFVDQPLFTGFSYSSSDEDRCYDEKCVANDMLDFFLALFEARPELKGKDIYITGESYAGGWRSCCRDFRGRPCPAWLCCVEWRSAPCCACTCMGVGGKGRARCRSCMDAVSCPIAATPAPAPRVTPPTPGNPGAGHYVPAVASRLFQASKTGEVDAVFRLQGLAIGNGLTNPRIQVQTPRGLACAAWRWKKGEEEGGPGPRALPGLLCREPIFICHARRHRREPISACSAHRHHPLLPPAQYGAYADYLLANGKASLLMDAIINLVREPILFWCKQGTGRAGTPGHAGSPTAMALVVVGTHRTAPHLSPRSRQHARLPDPCRSVPGPPLHADQPCVRLGSWRV